MALLHLWFTVERLHIVCLQELHLIKQDKNHLAFLQSQLVVAAEAGLVPTLKAYWAPSRSEAAAGVAVLVRASLLDSGALAISEAHAAADGRLLHMRCAWGGLSFGLVNAYLPSGDYNAQRSFLSGRIDPLLRRYSRVILGGDFNFTMDWHMDRVSRRQPRPTVPAPTEPRHSGRVRAPPSWHADFAPIPTEAGPHHVRNVTTRVGGNSGASGNGMAAPGASVGGEGSGAGGSGVAASRASALGGASGSNPSRHDEERVAAVLDQLSLRHRLVDAFRCLHPHTKVYTFVAYNGASRLDRFHVSADLQPFILQCSVAPPLLSDHRLVILHLHAAAPSAFGPGTPRVQGTFRSSPTLSSQFLAWLNTRISTAPPLTDHPAMLQWWPPFKRELVSTIASLDREHARELSAATPAQTAAVAAAATAMEAVESATDPGPLLGPALAARGRATQALAAPARAWAQRCQHRWIRDGEHPSLLLTSLLSPPPASRLISGLKSASGGLTTGGPAMAQQVASFWASISAAQPVDAEAEEQVLAAVRKHAKTLPTALVALAGDPSISEASVQRALRRCPSGKSPGPDGIPMEVWRWYRRQLGPLLAAVFSAIGHLGLVPESTLDGVVHPIYKAGARSEPGNYRPITLLNTDYRLLAKILASKLGPVLAKCIGPEQGAFLPERLIGDNIILRLLLPTALRLNGQATGGGLGAGGSGASAGGSGASAMVSGPDAAAQRHAAGLGGVGGSGASAEVRGGGSSGASADAQAGTMATAPAPTAAMVFLDFKKAYDTILRRFLLKVMEAVGAGEGCLKWARTLLTSTTSGQGPC